MAEVKAQRQEKVRRRLTIRKLAQTPLDCGPFLRARSTDDLRYRGADHPGARDQIKVKRLTQVVPPPFTGRGLLGDTAEAETGGSEEIRGARVVKKIQVLERRRKEE